MYIKYQTRKIRLNETIFINKINKSNFYYKNAKRIKIINNKFENNENKNYQKIDKYFLNMKNQFKFNHCFYNIEMNKNQIIFKIIFLIELSLNQ